jgi:aldose 1-epimerase
MSRYDAATVEQEGETLYLLRDTHTGAEARIWPAFGNNCLSARLPAPRGGLVDIVLAPESLRQVREQPSWWGVPLLFPWPGRIPGGRYTYGDQEYQLPVLDMGGNAGHGFVKNRPWKVEVFEAWDSAAFLRCSFSPADHPETLEGFPFPYSLAATYRLDNDGLHLIVEVANTGEGPLPFGFGAHPYFRLPLGESGSPQECRIHVPAARRWNLGRLGALGDGGRQPAPSGAEGADGGSGRRTADGAAGGRLTWDDVTEPVPPELDLRRSQPLGAERHFDFVYTDPDLSTGRLECSVADPTSELQAVMQASTHFPTLVVYTPPGRPGVCFEPWTCPPNVFNLHAAGVRPSGLIELAPGQRWEGSLRLFLRTMPPEET